MKLLMDKKYANFANLKLKIASLARTMAQNAYHANQISTSTMVNALLIHAKAEMNKVTA